MFSGFFESRAEKIAAGFGIALVLAVGVAIAAFVIISQLAFRGSYALSADLTADAAAASEVRAAIAAYSELNGNLDLVEATTADDRRRSHVDIGISNLANGQNGALTYAEPAAASAALVNYQHNGCRSGVTTRYSDAVLFNNALAATADYLAAATEREFDRPDARTDTQHNLLATEPAMRAEITRYEQSAAAQRTRLASYDAAALPFAEWEQYRRAVAAHNTTLGQYQRAVSTLNCALDARTNAFRSYSAAVADPPTIRYTLVSSSSRNIRTSLSSMEDVIERTISRYQSANPTVNFQEVESGADIRLQFGVLSTQRRFSSASSSAQYTISAALRSCRGQYHDYTADALVNHATTAIADFISSNSGLSFNTPRDLGTANNTLAGESRLRRSISTFASNIRSDASYLNSYRFRDRVPLADWPTYQFRLINHNSYVRSHNTAVRDLNCMLGRTAISTRYSELEPQRREGQYYFAVDSVIGYDGYFQRIARESADVWESYNSHLEFTLVSSSHPELDLYIEYIDVPESKDYVGTYCSSRCRSTRDNYRTVTSFRARNYGEILVDTNGRSCQNEIVHYEELYIRDVTMHEIGHFLGLGHTSNENHLLYALRNPAPMEPFDELGLNVPPIPAWEERRRGVAATVQELRKVATYRVKPGGGRTWTHRSGSRSNFLRLLNRIRCLEGDGPVD